MQSVCADSPRSLPTGKTSAVYAVRFVYREGRVVINNAQTVIGLERERERFHMYNNKVSLF